MHCTPNSVAGCHCIWIISCSIWPICTTTHTTTVLRPIFWDHPGEPVPEEKFWTLWCKGRLTEADTPTIRLGATPSRLTSATSTIPPFLQAGCPSCLPTNSVKALKATSAFRFREDARVLLNGVTSTISIPLWPIRNDYLIRPNANSEWNYLMKFTTIPLTFWNMYSQFSETCDTKQRILIQ